ncbi:LysM peptidoglycan-binding domain-containing protein [Jatrophihabitans sp. DSM 45814]
MRLRSQLPLVSSVAADGWVLLRVRPRWHEMCEGLAAPHDWVLRVGTDQAAFVLLTGTLWLVALWLALGLGSTALGLLPGRIGSIGRGLATKFAPLALQRIVIGAAGASILLGTTMASADPLPPSDSAVTVAASSLPAIDWVRGGPPQRTQTVTAPEPVATGASPVTNGPAITWPTDVGENAKVGQNARPSAAPATRTSPPRMAPSAPKNQIGRGGTRVNIPGGAPTHAQLPTSMTVKRGDSLWLIAAHRLGPQTTAAQIAREWPRWYAQNRSVVGDDPGLLVPGEQLNAPSRER